MPMPMPGGGGFPPMMGGGMPMAGGGPPPMGGGMPPMGGPMPPPAMALSALDQLAQAAPSQGIKELLIEATTKAQVALSRAILQSPKASKLIADAIGKLQQARTALDQEGSSMVAPPPNLLGGMIPMPMGSPVSMPTGGM